MTTRGRPSDTRFYYGWVILAVATLATFTSAPGQTFVFSVFLPSLRDELSMTSTEISTFYLLGSLSAAGLIVGMGRLLDMLGARVMLVAAVLMLGLGAVWMSAVRDGWELYVGFTVLRAMGQGALTLLIPPTLVSIWFIRRRAFALAVAGLGVAVAASFYPVTTSTLIDEIGWRDTWVVLGAASVVLLAIPAALFVRRSPESVGLRPDGAREVRPDLAEADPTGTTAANDSEPSLTLQQAMRTRALWLLLVANTSSMLIGTGVQFHQIALMADRGVAITVAALVFSVTAATMLIGQFLHGVLVGRFAGRHLIAAGQVALFVVLLLLLRVSEPWLAYLYGAGLGLSIGFLINADQAIWPTYFGRRSLGSIRGIATFSMMVAAALGPLPLALARDATGSYDAGLTVLLCLPIISAIAAELAGPPGIERKALTVT